MIDLFSEQMMGITRNTYTEIIKEYEELRQKAARERDERIARITLAIPEYSDIESEITSLYVSRTMLRLQGGDENSDNELKTRIHDLKIRQTELLAAAGFSPYDLKEHYNCASCSDSGYLEDGSMCTCFRDKIIEKLYDLSHIRSILGRENFKSFDPGYYDDGHVVTKNGQSERSVALDALRKARSFVDNFDNSSDNIFLCGGTGVGKTFLSNCIAKELIGKGRSVIYLSAVRFFEILADAAFDRDENGELTASLIYDCDLLIIDDLGTEMTNSFVQTQLFDCINERILRNRHTVISTNLSVEELQAKYSERVFSRVVSSYTIIKLFARDIRIQKALEV